MIAGSAPKIMCWTFPTGVYPDIHESPEMVMAKSISGLLVNILFFLFEIGWRDVVCDW